MRNGDFGVDVVPHDHSLVRELESGHILARPGTVYRLRLRNYGPLYCLAEVEIDGRCVTGGGLVLRPWSATELERPVDDGEDGRFTVIAEGDESVFGPDGGRDNDTLGLIDARFRRELPRGNTQRELPPVIGMPMPSPQRFDIPVRSPARIEGFHSRSRFGELREPFDVYESAAGTGLTGHSDQRFVPATLGPLETEATMIRLRLVVGSRMRIADEPARPAIEHRTPARPAARP